jgi:thiol-disulfide isomerase/thioredoxin/S1-C subfamily serine protease
MVSWFLSFLLLSAISGQSDCTIVYFGAANCAPCEQMTPVLSQLQQEGWDIRAVDASQNAPAARQYRIQNLPTLVIVSNSKEVDRIVGAVSYEQLHSRFLRAAARTQSSTPAPLANSQSPKNTAPSNTASANTASSNTASSNTAPANTVPTNTAPAGYQGPIVRGQSPASNGFPMLADSPSNFASISPNASDAQVVSALHETPAATTSATLELGDSSLAVRSAPALLAQSVAQASPVRPTLTIDQAIARAADATVRIKVEESNTTAYGTGTIIDVHGSEALVLTCGHLFRDMKPGSQLSVELFAGTQREMSVFAQLIDFKAEEEDIGLLSFQLPVAIEPVEILPRAEKLQIGQPAFSFGCDHGNDPTRRDTQIRNINRYIGAANVEILGAPAVGRSGGGLFDVQGRLIGVCNAADATDDEGIYAAAEVVYTQIERLGMAHLFDAEHPAPIQLASAPTNNPPVQPASFAQPAVLAQPAGQPTFGAQNGDQSNSGWNQEQYNQTLDSSPETQEIICIVRDREGQSRIVTIPGPSPELLRAIEQNARR